MHVLAWANVVPDVLSLHPDMAPVGAEGGVVNAAEVDVSLLQQIPAA